jgi:hypothetical protein
MLTSSTPSKGTARGSTKSSSVQNEADLAGDPDAEFVLMAHRQCEHAGKALGERRVAGDLAADVADHPPQPGPQEFEFAPRALELVGVGAAPNHDRCALGQAPIALTQRHIVALGQIDQLLQGAMAQPRVGRVGDRFWLQCCWYMA